MSQTPEPPSRTRLMVAAVGATAALLIAVGVIVWAVTSRHDDSSSPSAGASGSRSSSLTSTPTSTLSSGSGSSAGSHPPSASLGTSLTPGSGATEPTHAVRTKNAVALHDTADFGTGMTVRITRITPIVGRATAPGEVGGPALRIALVARNSSSHPISLDGTVVFVSYGPARTPAVELSRGERRFRGAVAPGGRRGAIYVFTVPKDQRGDLRVEVS